MGGRVEVRAKCLVGPAARQRQEKSNADANCTNPLNSKTVRRTSPVRQNHDFAAAPKAASVADRVHGLGNRI